MPLLLSSEVANRRHSVVFLSDEMMHDMNVEVAESINKFDIPGWNGCAASDIAVKRVG